MTNVEYNKKSRGPVYLGNAIFKFVFSNLQMLGFTTYDSGLGTITKKTQTRRGNYNETWVIHDGHNKKDSVEDHIYFTENNTKLVRDCPVDGIVTLAEKKSLGL